MLTGSVYAQDSVMDKTGAAFDNATVKTTSTSEKAIVTSSYGTTELKNGAKVLAPSSTAIEMKNNSSF